MSLRLKAATCAALALSAMGAITASDISSASEAPPSTTALVQEYQGATSVPSTGEKSPVIFAAPKEVVQRTAPTSSQATSYSSDSQATSLAALVDAQSDVEVDREMRCLAGAVYFESKGESFEGQLAVARVVINRSKSGRFADSLCGVVHQRGQFSFIRGSGMPNIPEGSRDWREAVAIAKIALADSWDSRAEGALFFHARHVSPGWGRPRLASIDNHIFYR